MLTSVKWLNEYLNPGKLRTDEAVRIIEAHAFPIESVEELPGGDARLDVELTSNRGDAFSHLNLARDIAAATGRSIKLPGVLGGAELPGSSGDPADLFALDNRVPELCPLFTARIIRGVKVDTSPKWLREALEAVGQRSINNIVDVSNYVLFELGHPSHTFDLATLAGSKLIIRQATEGESLTVLDGKKHKLTESDLVVADEQRAVSLAGVIGGLDTGVTETTTDVLLEVATWDPATVRNTARRLNINTDAGYRFARTVDMRDLEKASARCAELILEVAGGELVGGSAGLLKAGREPKPLPVVTLRPERCEHLLGIDVPPDRIAELLGAVGFGVEADAETGELRCTVPPARVHDVTREVDVIEEVARLNGFDHMEVASTLPVQLELRHPRNWEDRERAIDEVNRVMTSAGFYETVTFSFLTEEDAAPFTPEGMRLIRTDPERRREAPYLRPSLIPSLLHVRRLNQDARVYPEGGVRVFEIAAVFAEVDDGEKHGRQSLEHRNLGVLLDVPDPPSKKERHAAAQDAMRLVRGTLNSVVRTLHGGGMTLDVKPTRLPMPAFEGGVGAQLHVGEQHLGYVALLDDAATLKRFDLERPVVAAELGLPHLLALYPPRTSVQPLPAFPGIERDVSLIVDESVPWADVHRLVAEAELDKLVSADFVTTFRGKPIEAGRKSVTARLTFRDPERTLRHDEVDPQIDALVASAKKALGAERRG